MHTQGKPAENTQLTIGMDIGGTNLRAAVLDPAGNILAVEKLPTPSESDALENAIVQVVVSLKRKYPQVAGVGMAVAGFLAPDRRTIRFAPHLPWENVDIVSRIQPRIGLPTFVEHDANAAAIGEYHLGAAQGAKNWVLFAIGTGIGAALMIDGELYRGSFGTAPELGHLTVMPGGRACPCGKKGCLERYCSGSALQLAAHDRIAMGDYPQSVLFTRFHRQPEEISGRHIVKAARSGDQLGLEIIDDVGRWLGRGLAMVHDMLDPELIVLAGGVSTDADLFLGTAKETLAKNIVGRDRRPLPRVIPAELGGDAGMIGVSLIAARNASGTALS